MNVTGSDSSPAAELGALVGGLRSNAHIADATTVPLLSAAECAAVIARLADGEWAEMEVWSSPDPARPGAHRPVATPTVRRGRQRPVPDGNSGAVTARITEQVFEVNRRVYRFRLVGVEDPVQVLWYGADLADEYVAHMDLGPVTSLRKLSFSLLLSDPAAFEGGDLAFGSPFPLARAQGTLTIFPSFLQHAVTPVTSGDRYAIVGFVVGPAFS